MLIVSCGGGGGGGDNQGDPYSGIKAPDVFCKDTTNVKPYFVNPSITGLTGNSFNMSASINSNTSYDFHLYNSNSNELTFEVSLQGGDIDCFTLDKTNFTSTIPPMYQNSNNTFTIRFNPTTTGLKTTKLLITGKFSGEKLEISINANVLTWDFAFNSPEGNGDDQPLIGIIDSNGKIIVGGYGNELIDSSSGNDAWIKRFDSSGNNDPNTDTYLSFTISSNNDMIRYMAIDSNDNIFVSNGDIWNGNTAYYGNTRKVLSSNGQFAWEYNKGGYVVVSPLDGSIFIIGRFFVTKLDQAGNVLWEVDITDDYKKSLTTGDYGRATHGVCDSLGNLYVGGYTYNYFVDTGDASTGSHEDWKIIKLDTNGNKITTGWNDKVFDNDNNDDEICSMVVDIKDNLYVAAKAKDLISTSSDDDYLIKKYSSDGTEDTSWNIKIDEAYIYGPWINLFIDDSNNITAIMRTPDIPNTGGLYQYIKVLKYTKSGTKLYEHDFRSADRHELKYVLPHQDGYIFIGCQENRVSENSEYDWRIKKYDSQGNEM